VLTKQEVIEGLKNNQFQQILTHGKRLRFITIWHLLDIPFKTRDYCRRCGYQFAGEKTCGPRGLTLCGQCNPCSIFYGWRPS
jgi:hypothetical protein